LTAVELNQEAASLQQPMPTLAEPARFHDGADTERLQIEQTLPASDARPIADEKASGEEGGPFEPPLVLRRMAE
jgi:hypothetical protein